jgi:hypothetical protein
MRQEPSTDESNIIFNWTTVAIKAHVRFHFVVLATQMTVNQTVLDWDKFVLHLQHEFGSNETKLKQWLEGITGGNQPNDELAVAERC